MKFMPLHQLLRYALPCMEKHNANPSSMTLIYPPNFDLSEMYQSAKCGSQIDFANHTNDINAWIMSWLCQKVRDRIDTPVKVLSCYRGIQCNKEVDGASDSAHLYGLAVDIQSVGRDKIHEFELLKIVKHMIAMGELPDGGLGYYPRDGLGWIHLDPGPRRRWTK